jgi:hypothetical protein
VPRVPETDDRHRPLAMLEEAFDLLAGAVILPLPLLLTAIPGIALFVIAPAIVLLAIAAVPAAIAAVLLAPFLLVRALRRR